MVTKKRSTKASATGQIKSKVDRLLKSSSTPADKVDLEALRKSNPPLADVLDEFIMSKTTRDDRPPVYKDLARVLEARDPKSRLGKALAKLEGELAATKKSSRKARKR